MSKRTERGKFDRMMIEANGRRNILAFTGLASYIAGAIDAYSNLFPDAAPATFLFWGTALLTSSTLRRRARK